MTGLEEKAALEIGKSVLQFFASQADGYIKKAQEYKDHDIRACENYLEAARTAITGLEAEYDKILVQATNCDLSKPDQIKELKDRIGDYLRVDILRPKLKDAVEGLGLCREALQKNAEGFFLWLFRPQLGEKRHETIAEFDSLLQDLQKYLNELDVKGLTYLKSGTGAGAKTLLAIEQYLDSPLQGNIDPYGLARLASEFQRDPSKDHLMDYIERIRGSTHHVRNAFR